MFDFLKCDLPLYFYDLLVVNEVLEFQAKVNLRTGELEPYISAFYKNLTFKIYEDSLTLEAKRITVEGSLHKYWNEGAHNYNDFGLAELDEVLQEIKNVFHISPRCCLLRQLEVGVNFEPPLPTDSILTYCLLHKTSPLQWMYTKDEGSYKQAKHKYYFVKIYDKRKHYVNKGHKISSEIMRFELKYRRSQLNQEIGKEGAIRLQDVLDFGIHNFKNQLLKEWDNVLFFDFTRFNKSIYKERYSNPNFWIELRSENFKYHRKQLNLITNKNPLNLKESIKNLITDKINFLTDKNYPNWYFKYKTSLGSNLK